MSGENGSTSTLATRPTPAPPARRVVEDSGPLAFMMDTARYEHMQRIATSMAASVFLPDHLRGTKRQGQPLELYDDRTIAANCFRVLNQAVRWGVDPFAVADETFVTGGKLGYQGKLVTAIVNTRAGLDGRLKYSFSGTGDDRKIIISGKFPGDPEPRTVEMTVRQGITASDKGRGANPMWKTDPDQKLVYSGVVKWARRHCPEVIMGVLTEDDVERIEADRARANDAGNADLNARLHDAFSQPVAAAAEVPPAGAPMSHEEGNRIIERRAREARGSAAGTEDDADSIGNGLPAADAGGDQGNGQTAAPSSEPKTSTASQAGTEVDVSDAVAFRGQCLEAAMPHMSEDTFSARYAKAILVYPARSGRRKEWEPARQSILAAFAANKIDENGKIVP